MDKQYFIFVTNDISMAADTKISAVDIKEQLLEHNFWAFTETAPLRAKLNKGDGVLIYLAGIGRRQFVATANIAAPAEILQRESKEKGILNDLGLGFLKYKVDLVNIHTFATGVKIVPLLQELRFVIDKKNYGLHLRLPIVRIKPEDFQLVLKHMRGTVKDEVIDVT